MLSIIFFLALQVRVIVYLITLTKDNIIPLFSTIGVNVNELQFSPCMTSIFGFNILREQLIDMSSRLQHNFQPVANIALLDPIKGCPCDVW